MSESRRESVQNFWRTAGRDGRFASVQLGSTYHYDFEVEGFVYVDLPKKKLKI
jgi:hypothetical protein